MRGMTTIIRTKAEEDDPYPRAERPSDIPVSVAMAYAAWGYAMLNGDPLLADQLERLLLAAGALVLAAGLARR